MPLPTVPTSDVFDPEDHVVKIECLPVPNIPTDFKLNLNTECLIQDIKSLADFVGPGILSGLDTTLVGGTWAITPGTIVWGPYTATFAAGLSFSATPAVENFIIVRVVETRYSLENHPEVVLFTPPGSGVAKPGLNEIRWAATLLHTTSATPAYELGTDEVVFHELVLVHIDTDGVTILDQIPAMTGGSVVSAVKDLLDAKEDRGDAEYIDYTNGTNDATTVAGTLDSAVEALRNRWLEDWELKLAADLDAVDGAQTHLIAGWDYTDDTFHGYILTYACDVWYSADGKVWDNVITMDYDVVGGCYTHVGGFTLFAINESNHTHIFQSADAPYTDWDTTYELTTHALYAVCASSTGCELIGAGVAAADGHGSILTASDYATWTERWDRGAVNGCVSVCSRNMNVANDHPAYGHTHVACGHDYVVVCSGNPTSASWTEIALSGDNVSVDIDVAGNCARVAQGTDSTISRSTTDISTWDADALIDVGNSASLPEYVYYDDQVPYIKIKHVEGASNTYCVLGAPGTHNLGGYLMLLVQGEHPVLVTSIGVLSPLGEHYLSELVACRGDRIAAGIFNKDAGHLVQFIRSPVVPKLPWTRD